MREILSSQEIGNFLEWHTHTQPFNLFLPFHFFVSPFVCCICLWPKTLAHISFLVAFVPFHKRFGHGSMTRNKIEKSKTRDAFMLSISIANNANKQIGSRKWRKFRKMFQMKRTCEQVLSEQLNNCTRENRIIAKNKEINRYRKRQKWQKRHF